MNNLKICQYVIQGGFGYKGEKIGRWTTVLAEALAFDSRANAIAYINKQINSEYGCYPTYKIVEVEAKIVKTQFASFNMWQALKLEKALLVLSPDSVATENWTKAEKHPGVEPAVFTWVDCVGTPMQMRAIARAVSKHIQIAHCDYQF